MYSGTAAAMAPGPLSSSGIRRSVAARKNRGGALLACAAGGATAAGAWASCAARPAGAAASATALRLAMRKKLRRDSLLSVLCVRCLFIGRPRWRWLADEVILRRGRARRDCRWLIAVITSH